MSEAHLAGPRQAAAPDEAGGRDRVVGRAERPPRDEWAAGVEQPGHRVDAGDLDRLVQRERRQEPRQPPGEHRLAAPGGPDHEHGVPAGGGHLERPPGGALPAHLGEVGAGRPAAARQQRGRVEPHERGLGAPLQEVDGGAQGRGAEDLDTGHQSRLRGVAAGHDQAPPAAARRVLGHRERPGHRPQGPVEGELAHGPHARERRRRQLPGGAEDGQRERRGRTEGPPCAGRPGRGWPRSAARARRTPGWRAPSARARGPPGRPRPAGRPPRRRAGRRAGQPPPPPWRSRGRGRRG